MKQQQINKLYSKRTPNEQANLAFEAAMRKDEKDVDLILNSTELPEYFPLAIMDTSNFGCSISSASVYCFIANVFNTPNINITARTVILFIMLCGFKV